MKPIQHSGMSGFIPRRLNDKDHTDLRNKEKNIYGITTIGVLTGVASAGVSMTVAYGIVDMMLLV
jgi:hypothetical protein